MKTLPTVNAQAKLDDHAVAAIQAGFYAINHPVYKVAASYPTRKYFDLPYDYYHSFEEVCSLFDLQIEH